MDYRNKIIEEASLMFRTYGIRAVTMDMLASSMGISKRTIYEVFKDKDELLKGVLDWMTIRQKEVMTQVLGESDNVIEAIFKLLDLMSEHFRKMSPAFQMDIKKYQKNLLDRPEEIKNLQYFSNNSMLLMRGIKEGIFRNDIDLDITNKCMLEVIRMSNENELVSSGDLTNKDIFRNFYLNYLRGISTSKGLKLINHYEKIGNF